MMKNISHKNSSELSTPPNWIRALHMKWYDHIYRYMPDFILVRKENANKETSTTTMTRSLGLEQTYI